MCLAAFPDSQWLAEKHRKKSKGELAHSWAQVAGLLFTGSTNHITNLSGSRWCDRMVFLCQWRFSEFCDTVWYTIDKKGWHWTRKGKIRESKWGGWQWNMERRSKQWPAAFRPEWKARMRVNVCYTIFKGAQACCPLSMLTSWGLPHTHTHTFWFTPLVSLRLLWEFITSIHSQQGSTQL